MSNDVRQKKKSRKSGVPTGLVVLLIVIAAVMGGFGGFMIARRTAPVDSRLQAANERIIELENTLSLIGFPMDGDPENWVFDGASQPNGADDLAGVPADENAGDSVLWSEDDDILTGEISEDTDPVVVAEFNGGQLLSSEVIPEYNDQLAAQVFAGYNADEVAGSVLQSVLTTLVGQKVIDQKAAEMGLDQPTDEDLKRIEAEADRQFKDQVAYYTAFVARTDGMTQAELEKAAADYMRESMHITRESIAEDLKKALPGQKYREAVVKDVTVTDEAVQAHYQERLSQQKAEYTQYPEEFEYDHISGVTQLYSPEGYRRVRNLLIPFDSDADADKAGELLEEIARKNPDTEAKAIQALEAELEPLYKPMEARAAEIQEKLKAGEKFTDLMDQYGADELMRAEPLRTQGYYLGEDSFLFSTEFVQGAMILEQPGQVSTTLRSGVGLHLAEYAGDVPAGETPLEQVYEAMKAETLELEQDAFYEQKVSEALDAANVKYYPERLQ